MMKQNKIKPVDFKFASLTLCLIFTILLVGILFLGLDMHLLLILTTSVLIIISIGRGYSIRQLMGFMEESIGQSITVLMIVIMIGAVIASWIMAGTVPGIIYYGLKFISAQWFLPFGFLLCSLVSFSIGTSWGTLSTVGIALMGMGISLGVPMPIVAGMVISGSFFGDKMSPVSDTTSLASGASGANLYDHIKSMSISAVPSYLIALLIYAVLGFKYAGGELDTTSIQAVIGTIESNFTITPLVFLPMAFLFTLNIKKVPAVPAMVMGTIVAGILAVVYQGESISRVFEAINYGYQRDSGMELVDTLLNRGGIQSMMWTFSLAFIAIGMGGILDKVGYLRAVIKGIIHKIHNPGLLSMFVMGTTTFGTLTMAEVYLSIILSGKLFKEPFKEKGYRPEMLSRFIEEGGTLTQVFIPWSTTGAFIASTLGVATLSYAPYALFNYINPIVSIFMSFAGVGILLVNKKKDSGKTSETYPSGNGEKE